MRRHRVRRQGGDGAGCGGWGGRREGGGVDCLAVGAGSVTEHDCVSLPNSVELETCKGRYACPSLEGRTKPSRSRPAKWLLLRLAVGVEYLIALLKERGVDRARVSGTCGKIAALVQEHNDWLWLQDPS